MKRFVLLFVLLGACGGDPNEPTLASPEFVPAPEDEAFDPSDPPTDPDPIDTDDDIAVGVSQGAAEASQCPKRSAKLSPKGLTFVIHVSKHFGGASVKQLKQVSHLIRARDIFMIERNDDAVDALRKAFPCNAIHFIAYPDEIKTGLALGKWVSGIAIDWETQTFNHSQGWSVDKLTMHANNIRKHGKQPSVVPWWPGSFNDGHIVKKSGLAYDLAQIQNQCVVSADAFASAARGLLQNFAKNGLSARDIGFEISSSSFDYAPNHTGVDRSARCTRKAYGKGARAIYLYGNGHPHLVDYFHEIEKLGLRTSI
jgi:hypothetical protein